MSNKQRRPGRGRSSLWILLVLGGILLVVGALLYFASRGGGDGDGTPAIAVDPASIDYGDQIFETNLTFKIEVTNRGDGTLRFQEKPYIEIVEGC